MSPNQASCSTQLPNYVGFFGDVCIARGEAQSVAVALLRAHHKDETCRYAMFESSSGMTIELDLHGSEENLLRRLEYCLPKALSDDAALAPRAGPGRPKLGVVAREVTLLPRHWDWLATQPGGASVTLRKLVETAAKQSRETDRARVAVEAAHRFMTIMGGNLAGFEEACRALFAGRFDDVSKHLDLWPSDIRDYAKELVAAAQRCALAT